MTLTFPPHILTAQEIHELNLWTKAECYRFYVNNRRAKCTFLERMDLWLRAPYCGACILSSPFHRHKVPDISPIEWETDIAKKLGEDFVTSVWQELASDSQFAFRCRHCQKELAPWNDDEIYIVSKHLEEYYSIPLFTNGRRAPSERLRKQIFQLYDNSCFACGQTGPGLHIDHIYPQSAGGDAAFRNLQPLCVACGQKKGNRLPEEIIVWSNIYFGRAPSDGYEGLFW